MKAKVRTAMASSCPAGNVPGHSRNPELVPFRHFSGRHRVIDEYRLAARWQRMDGLAGGGTDPSFGTVRAATL
jgi:hypothetical protein